MKHIKTAAFRPNRAWGALPIANIDGVTVRLHWTDQPYIWHQNEGEEVFAVLHGAVDMHYKDAGGVKIAHMQAGDVFYAGIGCEHVAHPQGAAHILVVERAGSI